MNEQQAMKAIVVRQPWATLIALGVKTIETRPAPPNGPMRPEGVRGLPGLALERGERIAIVAASAKPRFSDSTREFMVDEWASGGYCLSCTDQGWDVVNLPLGAAVCTAIAADAVPVVDYANKARRPNGGCAGYLVDCPHEGEMAHQQGGLWLIGQSINEGMPTRMADQLPLGDFTPGRWGWLLTDVERCDPIPVKGKQGVFALPADVSERLRPKAVVA